MHSKRIRALALRVVLRSLAMFLLVGPACGRSDGPPQEARRGSKPWTRIEPVGRWSFVGDVAEDQDLSGLACISERFGLVGADESRDVQVVELSRQAKTLRIVQTIPLAYSGDEIDTEAIAAEGDCYYIIGSHGISKKEGLPQGNRYSIFRVKADPVTGLPVRPLSVNKASLAGVLRADPVLGEYFGKPLQQRGVNIEGLAVREGRLFVGVRGPNLQGNAFVLEVRADDVFSGNSQPGHVLHRLPLGPGYGIREIVAAKSDFLIIAGNSASEPSEKYTQSMDYDENREFLLFSWDDRNSAVHKIGAVPEVRGKAEAMTILEETEDHVTVLMLFDGPRRGRPTEYQIY
ncbi:MAG: DUF3616 domain-containing protein [Phycisphaerales bacterium]